MRMVLVLVAVVSAGPAAAQQSPFRVHYAVDGGVTAAAFAGVALLSLAPVGETHVWDSEPFGFDEAIKNNFSARAAALSDSLVMLTMASPLMMQLAGGFEEPTGQGVLIYAETLGGAALLNTVAKVLVQRPRPYVYSSHAEVQHWAGEEGRASRLSFYSGHATTAFAAAVAGSYLFAVRSDDSGARATLWGVELALAAATAGLRVRAGRHFISDVVVGAVVGAGLGVAIPLLHLRDRGDYVPRAEEWAAMAGGVAAGGLFAALAPFEGTVPVTLAPMALEDGGGLMLAGGF